jgi:tripeptide aminopeptidase
VKVLLLSCIFFSMATFPANPTEISISKLADEPRCAAGLKWIEKSASWVTDQQIRLTEIPAPEFEEAARGRALASIFEAHGLTTRTDAAGSAIGERAGSDSKTIVLVAAHLDTVFPAGTDVRVKRDGKRLIAPGISDNGAGLGALVGLARALAESRMETNAKIVLAGDVGEEGEGNLRGIRKLVETYGSRLSAVIALDGPSISHITTQAIASRRFEISITGPGGHSWSDFGQPNPIMALARGIVKFSAVKIPEEPRASYNFGLVEGGTSINSIPSRAAVKVDLRSEGAAELNQLEKFLRESMLAGMREEVEAAQHEQPLNRTAGSPNQKRMAIDFKLLGERPAGKLADTSPLVATVRNVDQFLGNRSQLESSSTDANIPLSLGIPAIAIGGGGRGGGTHTTEEWFDPSGRELGLKRLYLTVVALAGLNT